MIRKLFGFSHAPASAGSAPRQITLWERLFAPPSKSARKQQKIESDQRLKNLWRELRLAYFPDRPDLDRYVISWSSRRQRRVLGSCSVERAQVRIARELDHPECADWLSPLIYHEMCHAALGQAVGRYRGGKRAWHGPEFRKLERRHPNIAGLDRWIREGGWARAVRVDRARSAARARQRR